jgi:putative transposase
MFSLQNSPLDFNFHNTFAPFGQDAELPFGDILTIADVQQIFAEEEVSFGETSRSFWTPALTTWAFVWQVLSPDQSCRQAVANVVLFLSGLESDKLGELDTTLYCRARAKVPARVLERVALLVGQRLEAAAPPAWLWKKRHVKLIDGSTSTLPDTEENQEAFPQPNTQKKGLGYPMIRWVVLVGLATATIQGFAYGRYTGKETGETALFRQILDSLATGDLVLADRYYCSYFLVALMMMNGVDAVMRLHQRRKYDFQQGEQLGPGDHIVVWHRPERPAWMDEEMYALMPETIRMREIYRKVNEPGYRVNELVIATTLLDAAAYEADAIAELYAQRWHVELDIRSLKTGLGMGCLSCKSPFMVAKEIWARILAYNLVRKVGCGVAQVMKVTPRHVSFTATKQAILAGWQQASRLAGAAYVRVHQLMLKLLRKQKVGHRPGRCEPRAVKRRPKPHRLLAEPREEARAKLLKGKPTNAKAKPKGG